MKNNKTIQALMREGEKIEDLANEGKKDLVIDIDAISTLGMSRRECCELAYKLFTSYGYSVGYPSSSCKVVYVEWGI